MKVICHKNFADFLKLFERSEDLAFDLEKFFGVNCHFFLSIFHYEKDGKVYRIKYDLCLNESYQFDLIRQEELLNFQIKMHEDEVEVDLNPSTLEKLTNFITILVNNLPIQFFWSIVSPFMESMYYEKYDRHNFAYYDSTDITKDSVNESVSMRMNWANRNNENISFDVTFQLKSPVKIRKFSSIFNEHG